MKFTPQSPAQNKSKMSFSGKKFKRTRCEKIPELLKSTNVEECMKRFLTDNPVFSFTKVTDSTMAFQMEQNGVVKGYQFVLDKEIEMEKTDGSKLKFLFTMKGDNILHQTIERSNGKLAFFTREFSETGAKMTVTTDESDVEAVIYYDIVE